MQCRGIARRCPTGSLTVLGDIAQGTTPWSTADWRITLNHLGKPDARIEPLTRGYRVPADVIAFANTAAAAPRRRPRAGDVGPAGGRRPAAAERSTTRPPRSRRGGDRWRSAEEGSVGVIVADADVAAVGRALDAAGIEHAVLGCGGAAGAGRRGRGTTGGAGRARPRVAWCRRRLAKGLEFDHVVVAEPAAIVEAEPRGLRPALRRADPGGFPAGRRAPAPAASGAVAERTG